MLPAYGVVVGNFTGYTTETGQWYHVDMNIQAGDSLYQAAVDVNEVDGNFQYQIFNNLDQSLFTQCAGLPDGWTSLAPTPTSGAMDYARSPIFQKPLGCLAVFWAVWDAIFKTNLQVWTNVTGNEAGLALVAMVKGSQKVWAFGAPYTTGLGVHDVHCNQGDPPGPHQADDGIWQDGCVFALKADGTLSAYLGKFSTQTLTTNNQGLPA